jgi:hypothetical protein
MVVMDPFDPPLQETLVMLLAEVMAGGFGRVTLFMEEQPLASVTVTV